MSQLTESLKETFKHLEKTFKTVIDGLANELTSLRTSTQELGSSEKFDPYETWSEKFNKVTAKIRDDDYCKLLSAITSFSDTLKFRMQILAPRINSGSANQQQKDTYKNLKDYDLELDKLISLLSALCALKTTKESMCENVKAYGGKCCD